MATKANQTNQTNNEQSAVGVAAAPQPQQPVAVQQPMQQVQYVVMQQSLKGVGGWLIFWLICFGLAAIAYIWAFFAAMLNLSAAISVVMLIFSPILAVWYIASIVLISMQKRIGKIITWVTLGVSAISSVVTTIVSYVTVSDAVRSYDRYASYYDSYSTYSYSSAAEKALPLVIATIIVSIVAHALIALYFFLSKRVKETLVN